MFGIGFTEIMLISIIAILFLGPDKLPGALVDMAKFIKSVKKTVNDAKSSLEEEMKVADLKEEALNYKKQLTDATDELKSFKNISFDDEDDLSYDEDVSEDSPMEHVAKADKKKVPTPKAEEIDNSTSTTQVEAKQEETVAFKKKPKKEKVVKKEPKIKKEKLAKKDEAKKKGEA